MQLQKINNKRGISELISYVLLIVMAVAIASGVYIWLKTTPPDFKAEECPYGLSLIIEQCNINTASNQINLTFKNNGRFNVTGAFVYLNLENGTLITLETLPYNLNKIDQDYFPIQGEAYYSINFRNYNLFPENITSIDFIPVKNMLRSTVSCAKVSYPISSCT